MLSSCLSCILTYIKNISRVVSILPCSTLLILLIMWMPSSVVSPVDPLDIEPRWHRSIVTILDALIVAALLIEYGFKRIYTSGAETLVFLAGLSVFLLSWVLSDGPLSVVLVVDILVYWLRLFFAYVVVKHLTTNCTNEELIAFWSSDCNQSLHYFADRSRSSLSRNSAALGGRNDGVQFLRFSGNHPIDSLCRQKMALDCLFHSFPALHAWAFSHSWRLCWYSSYTQHSHRGPG